MNKKFLIIILSIGCFYNLFSDHGEGIIIWRTLDWPPMYIVDGPQEGEGLWDEFTNLIIENLSEYHHSKIEMTTQRTLKEMWEGKNVIHPSVLSGTENVTFSKLNCIILPHRIIIRKGEEDLFGAGESLSIIGVLKNSNLKGGISFGSYTEQLNKIVEVYRGEKHLIENNQYANLVQMLFRGNIDYIIQYSPVISYLEKKSNKIGFTTSYSIEEVDEKYLEVYFAAPKNQWGRDVIDKIDLVLLNPDNKDRINEIRLRWYDDKSKIILNKFYKEIENKK